MQRKIYVSQTRGAAAQADWVHSAVTSLGHEVWTTKLLEGGAQWWNTLLAAIQRCDLYLPLLSPGYDRSDAFTKELAYAIALERPLIPVHALGEIPRASVPAIAETQWVDVRAMDSEAEHGLLRAITRCEPAPPLPNPLPPPPGIPISYTLQLREVLARPQLSRQAQEWTLDEVERRVALGEEPVDLIAVLDELFAHDDFLNALEGRRQYLRNTVVSAVDSTEDAERDPLSGSDQSSTKGRSVFISYRRADTEADAGRLYTDLAARYGPDRLFKDVDNVPLGSDIKEHIRSAISQSAVLIALVGPAWDPGRLAEEGDWVRLEIELAIEAGLPIIPVRVRRGEIPPASTVPESIRRFCGLNAGELEHHSWNRDLRPILDAIDGRLSD